MPSHLDPYRDRRRIRGGSLRPTGGRHEVGRLVRECRTSGHGSLRAAAIPAQVTHDVGAGSFGGSGRGTSGVFVSRVYLDRRFIITDSGRTTLY